MPEPELLDVVISAAVEATVTTLTTMAFATALVALR
jgi:hypothetical protein